MTATPDRPGTTPTQQAERHTVDTITDPMLATLYNERDMLGRETDRLRKDWVEMRTRAERAEAELVENTGVVQALRRQRDEAEATLTAVRDELDRIAKLPTVNTTSPCDSFSTGVRWTLRMIRENALDQHGQTPKETT